MEKTQKKEVRKIITPEREASLKRFGRIGKWFQILCLMNIPVFGFIYMFVLAVRSTTPAERKAFARAYILYRILVLILAGTILYVLYRVGLSFVDGMLQFVK